MNNAFETQLATMRATRRLMTLEEKVEHDFDEDDKVHRYDFSSDGHWGYVLEYGRGEFYYEVGGMHKTRDAAEEELLRFALREGIIA